LAKGFSISFILAAEWLYLYTLRKSSEEYIPYRYLSTDLFITPYIILNPAGCPFFKGLIS
jgi:hypothetical protein